MSAEEEAPDLDRGLRAAFLRAGPVAGPASVLAAIEQITGAEAPRVSLRESPSPDSGSPVVKAGAAVQGLVPQGRANYQLQGEIARGGMGVILKGHDLDLGRDVALKILREDLSKRPEVVQRFVEEAQIGGQLQHPGIVPVYELGLMADQRPYFAMKLVKGRTLAALLAERKEKQSERRRPLDVFEAVCQTIAYAHSKGVVHRDLKPANILIGAFGEVQVVDWGLAKVLKTGGVHDEKRSLAARPSNVSVIATVRSAPGSAGSDSLSGSVLGTPAYMPPEQARGDVEKLDERSDVFSLGAILCEILTGAPPYVGEAEATLEQAANGRLEGALQRIDGCHADPDLVDLVKSCLVPAQSARPRSAEVLAERIHAYLASVEERARAAQIHAAEAKVRARATVLLAAAGIALVLLGGGGWTWLQQQRAARVRATETAVTAALQDATLARGKQDWPAALAALEHARARIEDSDTSEDLRAQVAALGTTIERESAAAERATMLAAENARLLAALEGMRQPERGDVYATDWKVLDQEYRDLVAAFGVDVDATTPQEAARVLGERGISVRLASEFDEWTSVRTKADDADGAAVLTAIADALDPEPLRHELRTARAAKDLATLTRIAQGAEAATLPAPTLRILAHALLEGRREPNTVIGLLLEGRERYPQDFAIAMDLGRLLMFGVKFSGPGVVAEMALPHYQAALALRPGCAQAWHEYGVTLDEHLNRHAEALAVFAAAVRRFPSDGHLRMHLAKAQHELGRHDDAIASMRRAIELDSSSGDYWMVLGECLQAAGRHEEALPCFRRALEFDPARDSTTAIHNSIGIALRNLGRYDEAIASYRRVLELDPSLSITHANLGRVLLAVDRPEEALASFRRAVELDPASANAHVGVGEALSCLGRFDEAIACYRRALELDPSNSVALSNIGSALSKSGRPDEAITSLRLAIARDPSNAAAHANLGLVLLSARRHDDALVSLRRALELDPGSSVAFLGLGEVFEATGRNEDALANYRRAVELGCDTVLGQSALGMMLMKLGRHEEAVAPLRRVIELDPEIAEAHLYLAESSYRIGLHEEAIAGCRRTIELAPEKAAGHYDLAWYLVIVDEEDLRDPVEAVDHARRAAAIASRARVANQDRYDSLLGAALYVDGEFEEARTILERSVAQQSADGTPHARRLFLALCQHRLGDDDAARRSLDAAEPELDALVANEPSLRRFVDEAHAALADPAAEGGR